VLDHVVKAHPEICWDDMRDMRNLIVHEYFGIDDEILWGTVKNDLPALIPLLSGTLQSSQ